MTPFVRVHGIAAPIAVANIDTDMLVPARFLKTVSRKGLASALFASQRYDERAQRPDFILNREPWRHAEILVALDNFGCGSSREHAPWALLDFGIRCIIAPSFADIFYGNCFKNGMLPVTLADDVVRALLEDAADPTTATLTVDLEAKTITRSSGEAIPFLLDDQRRDRLLGGVDDIAVSLRYDQAIAQHEAKRAALAPWLKPIPVIT